MDVSVRELKARLSEYLRRVQRGEEVMITHHGRPIGRIVPVGEAPERAEAAVLRKLRRIPGIRMGSGGKPLGSSTPIRIGPAERTLADIVLGNRD